MQDLVVRGDGYWLEEFQSSDLSLVSAHHAYEGTTRFLCHDDGPWSEARSSAWLDKVLADREKYNFSPFKLMLDIAGAPKPLFAGWAGFTALEETSEIVFQHCLADEVREDDPSLLKRVGHDLIEWFFETTYFSHVVSCVRTDDREGRALADALDFSYRESRPMLGMPCDVYQRFSPSMQTLVASA